MLSFSVHPPEGKVKFRDVARSAQSFPAFGTSAQLCEVSVERKYIVELQYPLYEPQLSRVASEVAGELDISELKLGELLSRGVGPLTKFVDKPVADKVAEVIRSAGADVAVTEAAPTPPTVTDTPETARPDSMYSSPMATGDEEAEVDVVPNEESRQPKRSSWLLPVLLLVAVVLALAAYWVWSDGAPERAAVPLPAEQVGRAAS